MIAKKKNSNFGVITNCEEARVLDAPTEKAPLVANIPAGKKVKIISKADKAFYEISVLPSVTGFIDRKFVKVE